VEMGRLTINTLTKTNLKEFYKNSSTNNQVILILLDLERQ